MRREWKKSTVRVRVYRKKVIAVQEIEIRENEKDGAKSIL